MNSHSVDIVDNYYVGLELRIGIQTDDYKKNISDNSFRYPRYGIGYYMGDMNRIILGDASQGGFGRPSALYAFFSSPVFRWKNFSLDYDIGFGVSYRFKTYDPESRPYNTLIGTKCNGYISLGLDGQIAFPGHSTLGFGVGFRHFSNGSFQKPNSGINLTMATLTYKYGLYKNKEKSYTRFPIEPAEPAVEWNVSWGNAVRMLDTDFDYDQPRSTKRWYSTTLSSAVLVQTSHRRKFGIGLDFFYFDWGQHIIRYRARDDGRDNVKTGISDNMAFAVYLAHEVAYRRFWAVTDLGFYLGDRVGDIPVSPWVYERIGVKYMLTDRLSLGLFLKAHVVKADYLELSVGYSIVKGRKIKKKATGT